MGQKKKFETDPRTYKNQLMLWAGTWSRASEQDPFVQKMLEKPEQTLRMLRLPAVDETQRRRVGEAFAAMPELKPARPC